ncbi:hypothetical protein DRN86_02925 [Candidatus Geothermarchaeota archaeon]|nr:MAG: hypothetical protein DRN86_02925 [Candidatus Geothermarchaeota archaeon]
MTKNRRKLLNSEKVDEILKLVDEIAHTSNSGTLIVVEGKKDEDVLRRIGVRGEILKLSEYGRNKSVNLLEKYEFRDLLILTDFDEEGEKMAQKLEKIAFNCGFKVNKSLRLKIRKVFIEYSKTIEGLRNILDESLKRRIKMNYFRNLSGG